MKIMHGDCLELLPGIPENSVDLILADLPYGTTECRWDSVLPLDQLWREYRRVLKGNGVAALFCAQPFTTQLINSNRQSYRYSWYWVKNHATGFMFAKVQPMRKVEEVAVFICNAPGQDNTGQHKALRAYMMEELRASGCTRSQINAILGNSMSSHYFTNGSQFAMPPREQWEKLQEATGRFARSWEDVRAEYRAELGGHRGGTGPTYNPQGLQEITTPKIKRRLAVQPDSVYKLDTLAKEYTPKYTGYPVNVLQFAAERGLHPTQKPVPLLEYLVKTYTNPGDTVLDNCMGSGSTGVSCIRTGRQFIGMEKDPHYFQVALDRLAKEQETAADPVAGIQ